MGDSVSFAFLVFYFIVVVSVLVYFDDWQLKYPKVPWLPQFDRIFTF